MFRNVLNKINVKLGMLIAGVTPAFAGITVDNFNNANLDKGIKNVEKGAKNAANTFLQITMWLTIAIGIVLIAWGIYMMASKDQREEGKLQEGLKLATAGAAFIAISFVVKKLAGVS